MITNAQAILSLRPDTQFYLQDDDLDSIVWVTPDIEPVTKSDLAKEIKSLELQESNKAAVRVSALAKLKKLGLTQAEIESL